jgi:hypothetical protein
MKSFIFLLPLLAGCISLGGQTGWHVHGTDSNPAVCFEFPDGTNHLAYCQGEARCRQKVYLMFDSIEIREDVGVTLVEQLNNGESKVAYKGLVLYCQSGRVQK